MEASNNLIKVSATTDFILIFKPGNCQYKTSFLIL